MGYSRKEIVEECNKVAMMGRPASRYDRMIADAQSHICIELDCHEVRMGDVIRRRPLHL